MKLKTTNKKTPLPEQSLNPVAKFLILFLLLSIVYANFWVMIYRSPYGDVTKKLPMNNYVFEVFDTFSVFSFYETINRDIVIKGVSRGDNSYEYSNWKDLGILDRYFPYTLGEQQMRLYLARHYNLGNESFQKACKDLMSRVLNRYNRQHKEAPISHIVLGVEFWPRSLKGYRELKTPSSVGYQILCTQETQNAK
jgi:hypothetical protein